AVLDDDIEDQAALTGGEIELVSVLHLTTPLDDDVGVRLEQADQFLAGRHRLTLEYPALALVNDTRDQRQIMIDPGAPPLGRHPDGLGQPFGDRLQLGPSGLDGGNQLAIERPLLGLAAAVVDGARPLLGQTPAVAPPHRRRFRQPPGPARQPRHDPSQSSVLSLGWCISAALTVLSMRTVAPLSSFSCWALASNAWLTASQVCGRSALIV